MRMWMSILATAAKEDHNETKDNSLSNSKNNTGGAFSVNYLKENAILIHVAAILS